MANKKTIEVARSFSQKVQVKQYEPIEFFCSVKAEVPLEELESISDTLDVFCQAEVEKSVKQFLSPAGRPPTPKEAQALQEEVDRIKEEAETDDEKRERAERESKAAEIIREEEEGEKLEDAMSGKDINPNY